MTSRTQFRSQNGIVHAPSNDDVVAPHDIVAQMYSSGVLSPPALNDDNDGTKRPHLSLPAPFRSLRAAAVAARWGG